VKLFDYWRSSASYRVRIACELKGLEFERVGVDLKADEHEGAEFGERNPQRLVPLLETGRGTLGQSLAIIEYLDEVHPERPLLPADPWERAQQRARAMVIACDLHPLCNLRVLKRLRASGHDDTQVRAWMAEWMQSGFAALEALAGEGNFLGGTRPMLADLVLVPQVYNARRFEVSLEDFPRLEAISLRCEALPAFRRAAPEPPA
jgi:maleylacetoacetate isomerase